MLDLKYVAQNFDEVQRRLATRGGNLELAGFRALLAERSALIVSLEALQAKRNTANEEMKRVAKQDPRALESVRGELRALSEQIKEQEKKRDALEEQVQALALTLPNLPDPSVPVGASAEENVVVRTWGEAPRSSTSRSERSSACSTSSAPRRCPEAASSSTAGTWRGWSARWSPS